MPELSAYLTNPWWPVVAVLLLTVAWRRMSSRRPEVVLPPHTSPPISTLPLSTPPAAPPIPHGEDLNVASLVSTWISRGARGDKPPRLDEQSVRSDDGTAPERSGPSDKRVLVELLRWGQQAARAGDRVVAHRLLIEALEIDPSNEEAWLWLAATADSPREAIRCLEFLLERNPANERARRGIDDLRREIA